MRLFLFLALILNLGFAGCAPEKSEAKSGMPALDSVKSLRIPKELKFAGEVVPLDSVDVYERLERELVINVYKHSSTIMILKRAAKYKEKILNILKEEGVPEDFFYLAAIESEFDPYANSGLASGFWQFTPATAQENNLEVSDYVEQRYDLTASTYAACRSLKRAKEKLGSWTMAAAAFNRGLTAMDNIRKQQQVSSYYSLYINPETYRYVFRILAIKLIMENPHHYGYFIPEEEKYKPVATKVIRIDKTIEDLAKFANDQGINYKILKYHNPWINFNPSINRVYKKAYRFEVSAGKIYYFELPVTNEK